MELSEGPPAIHCTQLGKTRIDIRRKSHLDVNVSYENYSTSNFSRAFRSGNSQSLLLHNIIKIR